MNIRVSAGNRVIFPTTENRYRVQCIVLIRLGQEWYTGFIEDNPDGLLSKDKMLGMYRSLSHMFAWSPLL